MADVLSHSSETGDGCNQRALSLQIVIQNSSMKTPCFDSVEFPLDISGSMNDFSSWNSINNTAIPLKRAHSDINRSQQSEKNSDQDVNVAHKSVNQATTGPYNGKQLKYVVNRFSH